MPDCFKLSQVEEQMKGTNQASDECDGFKEGAACKTRAHLFPTPRNSYSGSRGRC